MPELPDNIKQLIREQAVAHAQSATTFSDRIDAYYAGAAAWAVEVQQLRERNKKLVDAMLEIIDETIEDVPYKQGMLVIRNIALKSIE